jgi:hypothetical protein
MASEGTVRRRIYEGFLNFYFAFYVFILGFIQIQHLEEMVRKCLVFGETCRTVAQQASLILAFFTGWQLFLVDFSSLHSQ